jgi:hypothetical protein
MAAIFTSRRQSLQGLALLGVGMAGTGFGPSRASAQAPSPEEIKDEDIFRSAARPANQAPRQRKALFEP